MNPEQTLKQIEEALKLGLTPEEVLGEIKQIIPSKIIYLNEKKTSQDKLDYLKEYRDLQIKYNAIAIKQKDKEKVKQLRIERAKQRTTFFCFNCKDSIKVNSIENKSSFERKRGQIKQKLIISNTCPYCNKEVRAFGGNFDL